MDMEKKIFVLKPELTAIENLWEACNSACRYILKRKRIRLVGDEWDELLTDMTIATMSAFFRTKLGPYGSYCHEVDFWQNCYSCAWSISGNDRVITKFLTEIKNRLNSTSMSMSVGVGDEATVEDLIADTGRHPLEHAGAAMYEKLSGRYYDESREEALNRIWSDEDAENAEGGVIVDRSVIEQHRKAVLKTLHAARSKKSETIRKWRARLRVEKPERYKRYLEQERRRSKARYDRQKAEKASRNASNG